MKIYVDILFAVNFMIDSLIIYAAAVVTKFRIPILRLAAAAAVSALYGTVMFFPGIKIIYSAALKLVFTVFFVLFTYKTYSLKSFFKTFVIFYFISFIFAGTLFCVIFLTNSGRMLGAVLSNGELYLDLDIWVLLAVTAAAYIGIIIFTKVCERNYSRERIIKEAAINFGDTVIEIKGLIDTGCELIDPISGKPAILIESGCIKDSSLFEFDNFAESEDIYKNTGGRLRVIPFSSVGCKGGWLNAFLADSVEIHDKELYIPGRVTVGIAEFRLSEDGLYNGVINPDILEKREEQERGNVKRIYELFKSKAIFSKAKAKSGKGN